ncbi:MAG TPA: YjbQ family protein, partial [candidate division WOR-3 bacterium]|nr:YjbQ family protein [candidate division WOR-3 bacterium]
MKTFTIKTARREQLVDITAQVIEIIGKSGVNSGICVVYVPHTTAAITINENADPSVRVDIEETLSKLVPYGKGYRHLEGNAD